MTDSDKRCRKYVCIYDIAMSEALELCEGSNVDSQDTYYLCIFMVSQCLRY